MKKASRIVLIVVLVLCTILTSLTSCMELIEVDEDVVLSGTKSLEEYNPARSEYELTETLIPDGFIERFSYVDGYFGYDCNIDDVLRTTNYCGSDYNRLMYALDERVLVYIKYDDDTYENAKKYAMENLILSDAPVEEYNGYVFYDNFTNDGNEFKFPYMFNRLAYNDSNNTLIFLGLYCVHYDDDYLFRLYEYEWADLLEVMYEEWYSFSEKGGNE